MCNDCQYIPEVDCSWFCRLQLEKELNDLASQPQIPIGQLYMILRVAVTGKTATPGIYDVFNLLGRERVIDRLEKAIEVLKKDQCSICGKFHDKEEVCMMGE